MKVEARRATPSSWYLYPFQSRVTRRISTTAAIALAVLMKSGENWLPLAPFEGRRLLWPPWKWSQSPSFSPAARGEGVFQSIVLPTRLPLETPVMR